MSARYTTYPVLKVAACAQLHALQPTAPTTQAFALAAHLLQRSCLVVRSAGRSPPVD